MLSQSSSDRVVLGKPDKAKQLTSTDFKAEGGNWGCQHRWTQGRRSCPTQQTALRTEDFGELSHGWFLAMKENNVWKQSQGLLLFWGVPDPFGLCGLCQAVQQPLPGQIPPTLLLENWICEEQKGGRKSKCNLGTKKVPGISHNGQLPLSKQTKSKRKSKPSYRRKYEIKLSRFFLQSAVCISHITFDTWALVNLATRLLCS